MSQTPSVRDLLLDNGLRVHLIADASASEAAALLQVSCGSDDEPQAWPGLAHLLEHTLFSASAGFSDSQRLMSWVPARGGRLNATTRSDRTAFFFSLPPALLAAGLERLLDMLARPLLTCEAINQETAAIDAEYRLLCVDNDLLLEAALRHSFGGAPGLTRFQVGSADSFGNDLQSLQQALRAFHRQHYHAGAMTLWLQAPLSSDELEMLARQCARLLPPARPPPEPVIFRIYANGDGSLQQNSPPRLCLSFALNDWQHADSGWLNLLNQHLCDEVSGGLMARLRELDWADEVRLLELWRGGHAVLLSVQFTLTRDDGVLGGGVVTLFECWLARLSSLNEAQFNHSARLAERAFWQQPPLEQLCARAFGLTAPLMPTIEAWRAGIDRLARSPRTRLWVSASVSGQSRRHQGFTLYLAGWLPAKRAQVDADFCFWPQNLTREQPSQPSGKRTLLWRHSEAIPRLRLLTRAGEIESAILEAALRPLAAQLIHQQGDWRNGRWQGYWLMRLCADERALERAAASIGLQLAQLPLPALAAGQRAVRRARERESGTIAVRRLMSALTRDLTPQDAPQAASGIRHLRWQALLLGGSDELRQRLRQWLSPLPEATESVMMPRTGRQYPGVILPRQPGDAAVLLYCPLAEWRVQPRLMWRLMALFCQPLFFQRLRVEKKIGYVVSCRFHQWGSEEGIIFALQSSRVTVETLKHELADFLHGSLPRAFSTLSDEAAAAYGYSLRQLLSQQAQDAVWQSCEPFFTSESALLSAESHAWLGQLRATDIQRWLIPLQQAASEGWLGQTG